MNTTYVFGTGTPPAPSAASTASTASLARTGWTGHRYCRDLAIHLNLGHR